MSYRQEQNDLRRPTSGPKDPPEAASLDPLGPVGARGSAGGRTFWILFSVGWLAYIGIVATQATIGRKPLGPPLASALGPICLAVVLAWRRRDLLRPESTLLRNIAVYLGLGLTYATSSAVLSAVLFDLSVPPGDTSFIDDPVGLAKYLFFVYLILYAVLLGFLMWTESISRVRESYAIVAREAVLRARAEAKALRAQFNPHFVYNTLHSLMMLVREEPKAAEKAIEDVAALIRYASQLERQGQDTVLLRQEIEIAERYLALETLRLSDRLAVVWEVAPGLEGYRVPSFSLQTLLENAIKHGISPRPEGGTVRIRIALEQGHLAMSVEDDGMGADPGDVLEAEGKGLSLLARRLTSLCGPSATLTWCTAPGQGFSVLVRIPLTLTAQGKSGPSTAGPESNVRSPNGGERLP
ncbi:MAG: histidine kinase [Gemmatimonadota bacterium]|nr:MAG: histidine kinase [Gemmatimonadota bacterium]